MDTHTQKVIARCQIPPPVLRKASNSWNRVRAQRSNALAGHDIPGQALVRPMIRYENRSAGMNQDGINPTGKIVDGVKALAGLDIPHGQGKILLLACDRLFGRKTERG